MRHFLAHVHSVRMAAVRLVYALAGNGLPVERVFNTMQTWWGTGDPLYQEAALCLMGACMEVSAGAWRGVAFGDLWWFAL